MANTFDSMTRHGDGWTRIDGSGVGWLWMSLLLLGLLVVAIITARAAIRRAQSPTGLTSDTRVERYTEGATSADEFRESMKEAGPDGSA